MPQFPRFLEVEEGMVPWGRGCAFETLLCRGRGFSGVHKLLLATQ